MFFLLKYATLGKLFKIENLYRILPAQELNSPPHERTKKGKEKKNYCMYSTEEHEEFRHQQLKVPTQLQFPLNLR
jgi:hypothetical protein